MAPRTAAGYEHFVTGYELRKRGHARITYNVIQPCSTFDVAANTVNGLMVDGKLVLNFVKVLDSRTLRRDETTELKKELCRPTVLDYQGQPCHCGIAERCIHNHQSSGCCESQPTYNRYYIGLNDGVRSGNFVTFRPKGRF